MAATNEPKKRKTRAPGELPNPVAYYLEIEASTGYKVPVSHVLWHNRTKLDAYVAQKLAEARSRNAEAIAKVTPLFKLDNGLIGEIEEAPVFTSAVSQKKK